MDSELSGTVALFRQSSSTGFDDAGKRVLCCAVLVDMAESLRRTVLFLGSGLLAFGLGVAFSKQTAPAKGEASLKARLSKADMFRHALNRLTFGPRPGDLEAVERLGLKHWIDRQLHPEQIAENPLLLERLQPLESLHLSIREAYLRYPPPQLIAAIALGRGELPEDPESRALLARLADRYLRRKRPEGSATPAQLPNDLSDLEPRVRLADLLTPGQIETLRNGKPDEKKQLLESLPAGKQTGFVWALRPPERQRLVGFAPVALRRELMRSVAPQNVVASDLTEGKILRAVYSNRQLQELLVDFWFNHFNVYLNKGADRYTVPTYERDAIRPHVFGKFHDLLLETAKSPAMLFYLDNAQSVAPEKENASRRPNAKRKRGLNENYGRELLELHTLGVEGGYTQRDVVEVARCFTGWGIAPPKKGGTFDYNDKVHDKGQKVVLGHVIPAGGGMSDGLTVIDILSQHPSTARFVSLKLARRFVADDPPASLVAHMAKTFLKTKGDLREVVRTMIASREFWSQGAYNAKIKTPFEMVVSSLRATNADLTSGYALATELQKLGEPLYRKIEPTGYSSSNSEWVSSGALLERMNFALALAHNRLPGVAVDVSAWQATTGKNPLEFARSLLGRDPSPQTAAAIEKIIDDPDLRAQLASRAKVTKTQVPSLIAGITLGSPEFQHR